MFKNFIKIIIFSSFIASVGFSFLGQTLIASAVDAPTAPAPTATKTATPNTAAATLNANNKGFGVLKECQVSEGETVDATKATERVNSCIKQVIQLVIVISILLAVISITVLGIQTMNPLATNAGSINTKIADRIKSIAVGGVILGMFGTILGTINPATLNTDAVFGKKVIAKFREYIGNGTTDTKSQIDANATGRNTATTPDANLINSVIKPGGSGDLDPKLVAVKKKELEALLAKNDECTDIFSEGSSGCGNYDAISDKTIKKLNALGINSPAGGPAEFTSDNIVTNYEIASIIKTETDSVFTIKFTGDKGTNQIKVIGKDCKPKTGNIKVGTKAFDGTCIVKIL